MMTNWKKITPYIYHNGAWKKCKVYIKINSSTEQWALVSPKIYKNE